MSFVYKAYYKYIDCIFYAFVGYILLFYTPDVFLFYFFSKSLNHSSSLTFIFPPLFLGWIPWVSLHVLLSNDLMLPLLHDIVHIFFSPSPASICFPPQDPTSSSCSLSLPPRSFFSKHTIGIWVFMCLYLSLYFPFLILLYQICFCTSLSFFSVCINM